MGDTFIKIQLKQLKIKTIKDLLYIVSNYQSGYIEAFLEHYSIEKYFKDYECSGNTGLSKEKNIKEVKLQNLYMLEIQNKQ